MKKQIKMKSTTIINKSDKVVSQKGLNSFFANKKLLLSSFILVLVFEVIKIIVTVARPKYQIAWVSMFNSIAIILLTILVFLLYKFKKIKAGKFFISTAIFLQVCYTIAYSLYTYPKTPVGSFTAFVFYILFGCLMLSLFITTLILHTDRDELHNAKTIKAIEIIDLIVCGASLIFAIVSLANMGKGFTNDKLLDFFAYISFSFLALFFTSCDLLNMLGANKNKLGLKLAFSMIGLPLVTVLTLAQIDVCSLTASKCEDHSHFFRDIAANNANFKTVPLTHISMLASHDALSDGIDLYSGINDWQNTSLTSAANVFAKGMLVRFSRAQRDSIYDQLNAGVRYIDARICHVKGTYYNSHTFLSDPLEHNLLLILKWLDENPGEFIVFHTYYFYDAAVLGKETTKTKDEEWNDLKTFIEGVKYNGKNLFDYDYTLKAALDNPTSENIEATHFENLNYNNITQGGTKAGAVIYFSSDTTATQASTDGSCWSTLHNYYNNADNLNKPCAVRMDSQVLVEHVQKHTADVMKKMGISFDASGKKTQSVSGLLYENRTMRYIQTQNTPNTSEATYLIPSWSLIQKAFEHNDFMLNNKDLNWSDTSKDSAQTPCIFYYYPIYMCDYTTSNETGFNTNLINQMSKFNKTLL